MRGWIALSCLALLALPAHSKPPVRLAGVSVSAAYVHTSGFAPFYPFYGYPFFGDPLWCATFVHPGFYSGFMCGPNMGEVRLRTAAKSGDVYLDGSYAGELAKLKHIWLEPGAYNLVVKSGGRIAFEQRVYVLSGKTLALHPKEIQQ